MKVTVIILAWLFTITNMANAQTVKTVGSGGDYATLKAAFDAINAGTVTGSITLQIISSITDNNTAALSASGTGSANYTSVLMYPTASGYTLSGSVLNPLIALNGADNVTIEGRVNASGSVIDLVITNTRVATAASTIRFLNSAQNNTIQYCTIKGSETNSGSGIILFSTSATGNGNDNNVISHNNLTSDAAGRPINVIYSSGTSGRENSGNIISNNNMYNFLTADYSARGVNIASNSIDWTISDNSFYETTSIVPVANNNYNVISINTSVNHLISGNYIGGSEPFCAGTAFTINSSFAHFFYGIYVNGGATTPVTVQNNIIKNINFTSTNSNPWDGIYLAASNTNVTVTGNTIGATTGTGSIVVNTPNAVATATIVGGIVTAINLVDGGSGFTTAPLITFSGTGGAVATAIISGGAVTGFSLTNGGSGYITAPGVMFNAGGYSTSHGIRDLCTGTVTLSNNNIGSISTTGTVAYSHCFEAIVKSGAAATFTVTNNLIGSLSTANSIQTSSAVAASLIKQDLRGIFLNATVTLSTITGNTIANLTNNFTANVISRLDGICTSGGSNNIQNNTIRKLTTGAPAITIKGIQQTVLTAGTNQTVSGNLVYDLVNTHATASVRIVGIEFLSATSGSNMLSKNFVHSLSIASSNINAELNGITIGDGVSTCVNNIIDLGVGITTGFKMYGIYDNSSGNAVNNNNIYYNTVYLAGTVAAGTTSSTGALWNVNNTSIRNYRNNILVNMRTGGATGKHYAVRIAGTSGLTIDYNDYYVSGAGILGYISGADKTTLALWKTATAQDVNSLNTDPLFFDPGDTNPADYFITADLPGVPIAGTATDFSDITRGAIPKMGALETSENVWQGGTSSDFGTAANWTGGEVPLAAANISFAVTPTRNCVLDQNRTVGNITNAQSTYKLVTNGFQLTVTGSLIFSNSAQIDATATSSVVAFTGTSAQSIPAAAFVSNTINALTVNNSHGLTLNNDFTIAQNLTLTNGVLAIGANSLTLNGALVVTAGTLTGGGSTNLIIGGSGAATLPAVVLNNFTLNRAGGIQLGGSVTVGGTLALTSGTLTVGAHTLTVSGNSPTRTSGYIDASTASATLVFNNASAISLPTSVFTGNVNNLTVSGAGGITSASDFTVIGILNLQTANASSTKGCLDMWDGSVMKTLTMGANATTTGIGDVTGIVTRTAFELNTPYSFGNQFTTVNFTVAPLPTSVSFKIFLTATHTWKADAIHRYYDIIRAGSDPATRLILNLHYLDAELNGLVETDLNFFDYHVSATTVHDHGHSNGDINDNWVGLSNLGLTFLGSDSWDNHYWTLANSSAGGHCTWIGGSPSGHSDWTIPGNWFGGVPVDTSNVIIPDVTYDPDLPANTTIGSLSINAGGILNALSGSPVLTLTGAAGAWDNVGTFNAGSSTVIFTNAEASMSDPTNFYNVTIADGATLTLGTNNVMRIAGALSLSSTGVLNAASNHNTLEFNGADQTIIKPNGTTPGYHELILSGSGVKTFPSSTMTVYGNITFSENVTATAIAALTIKGNLNIQTGSTFNTGNFNHTIEGHIDNSGTFNAAAGYDITMNGSAAQSIMGDSATSFYNLTVNNANHVMVYGTLSLLNTLTATLGRLDATTNNATVIYAGASAQSIAANQFLNNRIYNLIIDNSSGVTLNTDFTVNYNLIINAGKLFTIADAKTLTVH